MAGLRGSSILVTGGTGTFGRAFVKAALRAHAGRVCIYSRGEHAQALMRNTHDDGRLRWFIGDVRDAARLERAMHGCDCVVHAAALKRIEVCEYDPAEVVKTNVQGALNVIEAAMRTPGVSRVVGLSTDKACDPINAYGASKLLAEKIFLAANNARGATGPRFAVTRYGNVAGSTGSVIEIWQRAKAAGEVAKITDPEATRFWMTIEEAAKLVVDTLCAMRGGELAIPRHLPAYRLGDLAEAMGVKTEVVGLPPHEKLHESMEPGLSSDKARRMSIDELRGLLNALQPV